MGPMNLPYGQARPDAHRWAMRNRDRRVAVDADRVLWIDGIRLDSGRYVVDTLYQRGGVRQIESTSVNDSVMRSSRAWYARAAFEPIESSQAQWEPVQLANVPIRLDDLRPVNTKAYDLELLGIPEVNGRNPMLGMHIYGKELLVSAASIVLATLASSEVVFSHAMHPLDRKFYSRSADSEVFTISPLHDSSPLNLSANDLCCLAYWLGAYGGEDPIARVFDSILACDQLQVPRSGVAFSFALDGFESQKAIVVQTIGQVTRAQCWPRRWRSVIARSRTRSTAVAVSVLPDGSLTDRYRPPSNH